MYDENLKKLAEIKERNIEWKTIKQESEKELYNAKKELLLKRAAYIKDYAIPMLEGLNSILEVKDGKILNKRTIDPIKKTIGQLGYDAYFENYNYSKYEIKLVPREKLISQYRIKYKGINIFDKTINEKFLDINIFDNAIYLTIFDIEDLNKLLTDNGKFRIDYSVFKQCIDERIRWFKQDIIISKQGYKLVDQMLENYNDLVEKIKIYNKTYDREIKDLFNTNIFDSSVITIGG